MKYYTISYPGEHGQHVQETFSEWQIVMSYFDYWYGKMKEVGKIDQVSIENCIEDWICGHWAWRTDEFGNKIENIGKDDFEEWSNGTADGFA